MNTRDTKTMCINSLRRMTIRAVVALVLVSVTACSLDNQGMPPLIGPSGPGLSVTMAASPDQLPRDGSSQSVITVRVRDASGRAVSGQRITLGINAGALSQEAVVTGADGQATFAVRAPALNAVVAGNALTITATAVGTDSANASTTGLQIALLGTSNSTEPTAAFTVTPAAPELNQVATFDATTSTDEGRQCLDACTYQWNFDDGATAAGRIVTHAFTVARSYNVALTVTDSAGLVVTLRKLVTPTAPALPTVTLAVAPNPPVVNQLATFTAVGTAAANHQVVRYEWDFGDGSTDTTSIGTHTHTYSARGIYSATVRAVDDLGQVGSVSLPLDLTAGVPTGINAKFFFSPSTPHVGLVIAFNANESTPSNGASITNYHWSWGDNTADEDTSNAVITHSFGSVNSFQVQLTITDSQGRTSIFRLLVPVT